MKVLLLTASYGDGHHQVASALADAFSRHGAQVREFDCIRPVDRARSRDKRVFGEWLYESITRFAPWLYGISYNWTRNLSVENPLWRVLSLPLQNKVRQILQEYRPDAVLQLFPERMLSDLRLEDARPYIGMVVTDYSIHTRWYHPRVHTYFLPAVDMIASARTFADVDSRFAATGIPLRRQFWTLERPALDEGAEIAGVRAQQPYVLVAAGGRGLFPDLEDTVSELCRQLPHHYVYVMCGRNEDMLARVKWMGEGLPRLLGLPFVKQVASWYRQASFAVVKAGGLTVSECLATSCPMLLFRPQPGQEADNAAYVRSVGAGRVIHNVSELKSVLSDFTDESVLAQMREACKRHAHPDAAEAVARTVVQACDAQSN